MDVCAKGIIFFPKNPNIISSRSLPCFQRGYFVPSLNQTEETHWTTVFLTVFKPCYRLLLPFALYPCRAPTTTGPWGSNSAAALDPGAELHPGPQGASCFSWGGARWPRVDSCWSGDWREWRSDSGLESRWNGQHSGHKFCGVCQKSRGRTKPSSAKQWTLDHVDGLDLLERYTGRRSFICHSQLLSHLREHTHTCSTCRKDFKSGSTLQAHVKIHKVRKPYVCKMCGKRFRSSPEWNIHMRIHTGEKPYHCTTCGTAFGSSHSLSAHEVTPRKQSGSLCVMWTGFLMWPYTCQHTWETQGVNVKRVRETTTQDVETNEELSCTTCNKSRSKFVVTFKPKHDRICVKRKVDSQVKVRMSAKPSSLV